MTALTPAIADEADFVRRIKDFQAEAWDRLYDENFPKMYRYLYLHTGDREASEEMAAQVFEQACKSIRRFRYRGIPISSWLYRLARNVMVDWMRRRRRAPASSALTDVPGADPIARVDARDELARAMSVLTDEQRQVLILRHVEGHSAASAGAILGKKDGAVRSLEFRALATLRRAMSSIES